MLRLALSLPILSWLAVQIGGRVSGLLAEDYPRDFDGFYYLVEIRSRAEGAGSHYGRDHVFFWIAHIFSLATGWQSWGVLRAIIVAAWLGVGVSLASLAGRGRPFWIALLLSTCFAASDLAWELVYGFPKQGLSFALLAGGMATGLGANRGSPRSLASLALLAFAPFVHRFAFVPAVLCFGFMIRERITSKTVLFGLLATVTGLAGLTFAGRFDALLGAVTFARIPAWEWAWKLRWISAWERFEYWFLACAVVLTAFGLRSTGMGRKTLVFGLAAVAAVCMFPLWSPEFGGFAYRLARSGAFLAFFLVSVALGISQVSGRAFAGFLACCLIFLAGSALFSKLDNGIGPASFPDWGSPRVALVRDWLPNDAQILAPHGLQYQATYYLRRKASRKAPLSLEGDLYELTQAVSAEGCRAPSCLEVSRGWYLSRL